MKAIRIGKDDIGLVKALDPYEWLRLMGLPNMFALGAVEDDGIVGLLVAHATRREMTIDWIASADSFRYRGAGEFLIRKAFEACAAGGIPSLCAAISPEYEREDFSSNRASFFSERLFEEETELCAEWFGMIGELGVAWAQDASKLPEPSPLSSIPRHKLHELLSRLDEAHEDAEVHALAGESAVIDLGVSQVFMDGDEPYGAIIVDRIGDMLMPVCFFSESENEANALALRAIDRAGAKYGDECDICVLVKGMVHEETARKVLPYEAFGGRLLRARVAAYGEI